MNFINAICFRFVYRLVRMGKDFQQHFQTMIGTPWIIPKQSRGCDSKKEPKRVTWDELVHVRTIEPCPGAGRGKWHRDKAAYQKKIPQHWDPQTSSSHYSVTSPVFDL